MDKRYFIAMIAAATLLSACGKVEDKSNYTANAAEKMLINDEVSSSEETTDEETTDDETTSEEDVKDDTEEEIIPEDPEEYYNYILSDGFGFEMYMNGHISDSWDHRYEAAKLILEALSQPGTDELMMDEYASMGDLNAYETQGFMTHIKFENEKTFRVGNQLIKGVCVIIAGDEKNNYDFCIEYFDENGEYKQSRVYLFDKEYVPKLLEAVGHGDLYKPYDPVAEKKQKIESIPILEDDFEITADMDRETYLNREFKCSTGNALYVNGIQRDQDIEATRRIILEALMDEADPDRKLEAPLTNDEMRYFIYENDESNVYVRCDFSLRVRFILNDKVIVAKEIGIYGNNEVCYLQLDTELPMILDSSWTERIRTEAVKH